MQRRLRQACIALREHGCVSYAKIASASGFSNINLIIIKATAPDDFPLQEKYIKEILKIFSLSPSSFHSFSLSFTRRFGTTRSWRVAVKCLLLLHRLLRSVPLNSPLRSELLWTRSNGLISLYPCHFRDESSSCSMDYTFFIRSYAQLLDEALNCVCLDGKKLENEEDEKGKEQEQEEIKDGATPETFPEKMKEIGEILETLPQIQSLIDRVIDCRPIGLAARSFTVRSAMIYIVRDSFNCYSKFRREMAVVLDNLLQMPYRNCRAAFTIYKKAAVQTSQLCGFYDWCKAKGLCGFYEYPVVDRIPHIQIQALESFLNGMWELTESSSSPSSSPSTSVESPSTNYTEEEGGERQLVRRDTVHIKGHMFEDEEEKPLIDLEDEENDSWETLLESSVSFSQAYQSDLCFFSPDGYQWKWGNRFDNSCFDGKEENQNADNTWKIQVYKPAAYNPFSQPNDMSNYRGRYAHYPQYPCGL